MKLAVRVHAAEQRLGITLDEAHATRARFASGEKVPKWKLQAALMVIEESSVQRRPDECGKRNIASLNMRLPHMTAYERERINAVLLWRLGRAIGRIEERKVA